MDNEQGIIEQAKKDPQAFGALYDAYYEKIYRFIFFRTGNREIAKDLASETFFQALKNLWRYRFMRRPFSAWLYRIATTQVAMYYRDQKKYLSLSLEDAPEILLNSSDEDEHDVLAMKIDQKQDTELVMGFLKHLSDIEQNIIILRYFEDKSMQEISDILKLNLNTTKSHIRRALIRLRALYAQMNLFDDSHEGKKFRNHRAVAQEK